jgi:hypothetical protein
MATFNPTGLNFQRSLTSSPLYGNGTTSFNLSTGFSAWSGDLMVADNTQATAQVFPQYMIGAGTGTTNGIPTIGVLDSLFFTQTTPLGNMPTPSPQYQIGTSFGTSPIRAEVITDPFAIYAIQSDSATGLDSSALFKYFNIGGQTLYASQNATYSGLGIAFVQGDITSTAGRSKMYLVSASKSSTFNNNAANSVFLRVVGLAPGEIWFDVTSPSSQSAYNTVLVQVVNSAWVKPGSPA